MLGSWKDLGMLSNGLVSLDFESASLFSWNCLLHYSRGIVLVNFIILKDMSFLDLNEGGNGKNKCGSYYCHLDRACEKGQSQNFKLRGAELNVKFIAIYIT